MTDLSIVILTWNSRDLIVDCLESISREILSRQDDDRIEAEVLVVDNGSRDGTAELVRKRFPFVQVLALPENRGFAGGNNVGLKQ
ncbi:MAG: glycosyltransferase, partial [Myxococcota bacterium]